MLDLLISRLLTGRICLSEGTVSHALAVSRHCWSYAEGRELWKGRKPTGKMMAALPLVKQHFGEYTRCAHPPSDGLHRACAWVGR